MLLCCTLGTLLTTRPACPLHLNPQFHLEQAKQLPCCFGAHCTHLDTSACLPPSNPQFHLEQAKQRTQQRLAAGRPKPIDRLAHGLFVLEDIDPLEVG